MSQVKKPKFWRSLAERENTDEFRAKLHCRDLGEQQRRQQNPIGKPVHAAPEFWNVDQSAPDHLANDHEREDGSDCRKDGAQGD